jgi:glutaconate CoA-transferase, subunit A
MQVQYIVHVYSTSKRVSEIEGGATRMDTRQDKVMPLREAIRKYVKDGSHISTGGFTLNRAPMAAVYEIIRQGIRNLHLYAHSNGQAADELIGAGCVSRMDVAYSGNGMYAPTCIRFRKAVQEGSILVEDYSNFQMTLRFMAGAMGVPFLPTVSSLGTDLVNVWGYSEEMRRKDPRLPNRKIVVMENPFDGWMDLPRVVLVPAIQTDVTIIHVQKADRQGTGRIFGLTFADVEQAKSAKHLILTCEELLDTEEMRRHPDQNNIPFIHVDAVVHVPHGAYPAACYRYYDYDPVFFLAYAKYAADEGRYKEYLQKMIYGVKDHEEFISLNGGPETLARIKADSKTGYAVNLARG